MDPTQVMRDDRGTMRCRQCGFSYELSPEEIVAWCGEGLEAVEEAVGAVHEELRSRRPAPDVWSVNAYTYHLARAAEVISGRVRIVAEQECPPLPYYDQDAEAETEHTDDVPAAMSLPRLCERVEAFCGVVSTLPATAWDRIGRHERAGDVRLREIAHDMPHELIHHAEDIRRVGTSVRGGWDARVDVGP